MIIESRVYARAGLLGNPSDGYFGKTISVIIKNFGAHVSLYQTPELHIEPQQQDLNKYRNIYELVESVNLTGYYGGSRLIKATIKKFYQYCQEKGIKIENKNFTVRYRSTIPRQVGLAGSSAIITAMMKALMRFYEVDIQLEYLPTLILQTEADELGISAGLQDRVIQTYEGCVFMDFDRSFMDKHQYGKYEKLDPENLDNLYLAYKTNLSKVSGTVLNDIRTRFAKQEPLVVDTLQEIAGCAEEGKKALQHKDMEALNQLIDKNFNLRAKIMNITPSNQEMITAARSCGASAKFSGSGGAIIGRYEDDEMLNRLVVALKKIDARVIKPYII